ncbi:MAG: TIGR02147 family protein [Bdellovibrionales bacterium]
MILAHTSYRNYLKAVLAERITKNRSYSLRAFAKHLGVSPATLSEVLSAKKNLSSELSIHVANKLGLDETNTAYFYLLVQLEGAKSFELKERLIEQLNHFSPKTDVKDLSLEHFKIISDWYHYCILMMTELRGFDFNVNAISKRLKLSKFEVQAAINRLIQLELLEQDEKNPKIFRRVQGDLIIQSNSKDTAIRKYHRQLLELAMDSIETQTPQEKLIGTEMLTISQDQLQEASQIMESFFKKMVALSKRSKNKKNVYCASVQVFNLTKERE